MIHKAGQKLVYPKEYSVAQQASSAAWWTGAYAAYDFTAATYAAAKLDLTGNGRHCTDGTAYPTHTPGVGCTFNGTSQYLVTPITPSDNWSAAVKFVSADFLAPRSIFGMITFTAGGDSCFLIQVPTSPSTAIKYFSGKYNAPQSSVSYTYSGIPSTVGIAGKSAYYNGSPVATIAAGVMTNPSWMSIGALHVLAGVTEYQQYFCGIISSWVIWDTTRSDAQILATSAAMP